MPSYCIIQSLVTVSLEPSITISTQQSFQKIPTSPDKKGTAAAPEPLYTSNNNAHFVASSEEMDESQQPYNTFANTGFPESLMNRLSSPYEVTEYFPVSHVILNDIDWSLTVVNDGLCVMIYSFLQSKPTTAVKVCTVHYVLGLQQIPLFGIQIFGYLNK